MKAKGKKTTQEVVFDLYLSMTEREARALYLLTRSIGGALEGPRGMTAKLGQALYDLGIRESKVSSLIRGNVTMPNTWEELEGENY